MDANSGRVLASVKVGHLPFGLVLTDDAVWVTNQGNTGGGPGGADFGSTVTRIDRSTNEVTATIEVGLEPTDIVAGAGSVWVVVGTTFFGTDKIARISE